MKHYTLSFDLFEELPQQNSGSRHIRARCAKCMSGKNYCSICKTHKTPDSFYWESQQKNRRQSSCRECDRIRQTQYYEQKRGSQPKRDYHIRAQCAECMSGKNYCNDCKTHKTPDSFPWHNKQKNRRQSSCSECESIRGRVRMYNITAQEYLCLLASQNNKCAICHAVFNAPKYGSGGQGQPNVDHDHATGKVRELLCSPCNYGLGHFRDNINALGKAMAYLTKHKSI